MDKNINYDHLVVKKINVVNDTIPEPFVDGAEGELKLTILYEKQTKTPRELLKNFPFSVTVSSTGKITDCYSLDTELKESVCDDIGGSMVAGKCKVAQRVLCSNTLGERGAKDSISASFAGVITTYVRYYSSPTYKVLVWPGCGVGNVNDSAFKACMGWGGAPCGKI